MKKLFVLSLILVIATSCGIKEPKFISVGNIEIKEIKNNDLLLNMDYTVYNPNNYKASLIESDIDILYDKEIIGSGYILDKDISVPALDTISVKVNCNLDIDKLVHFLPEFSKKEKTTLTLKGYTKVKSLLGKLKIDIDDIIDINVNELIDKQISHYSKIKQNFYIKDVKTEVSAFNLKSKIFLNINWENPLPISYEILSQKFRILNKKLGSEIGSWESDEVITVQKDSLITSNIELNVNSIKSIINSGFSILLNQKTEIKVQGVIVLKVNDNYFELPVNTEKSISFNDFIN